MLCIKLFLTLLYTQKPYLRKKKSGEGQTLKTQPPLVKETMLPVSTGNCMRLNLLILLRKPKVVISVLEKSSTFDAIQWTHLQTGKKFLMGLGK